MLDLTLSSHSPWDLRAYDVDDKNVTEIHVDHSSRSEERSELQKFVLRFMILAITVWLFVE